MPCKQTVVGSIPIGSTIFFSKSFAKRKYLGPVASMVQHCVCTAAFCPFDSGQVHKTDEVAYAIG